MAKTESQYEKAKNRMASKRRSVDQFKGELRKQFKSRIRVMRSKSVDSGRNITHADVQQSYQDLVNSLESDMHNFNLIQPEHVFQALNEIQEELLQEVANEEVSSYESFTRQEIDAIVENLVTCKVCGQFTEKDICDNCCITYFSNF